MFNSLEDIYCCIAQNMINALPDEWEHAYLDIIVYEVDHSLAMGGNIHIKVKKYFLMLSVLMVLK